MIYNSSMNLNEQKFNSQILQNPDGGNVFQSVEFAKIKQSQGWTPRYENVDDIAVTVLEKSVFSLGKLWYIPKGPGVAVSAKLDEILPELKNIAQKAGAFMVKIEPEIAKTDETLADLQKMNLNKVRPIQPNFATVLIDLTPEIDEIMKNLNQKGRHAIRRAERDGVTIERVDTTDNNCRQMYDLLAETAAGAFGIRSYNYYRYFWQKFASLNMGQLFFAYADGKVVAGAFALIFGTKSTYKDGASTRQRTTYGASHLLQWEVIKWAKESGSLIHDLCGAPPAAEINNSNHPHYGIGRFKTSFNKTITEYVGAYDLVVEPLPYKIWQKVGERAALRLHHRLHHESFY